MNFFLAQLNPTVGAIDANINKLVSVAKNLQAQPCILVTPEMYLTGYPIDDLLHHPEFKTKIERGLERLTELFDDKNMPELILGAPQYRKNSRGNIVYNSLYHITSGQCQAIYNKYKLPNFDVFDEKRIFTAGKTHGVVTKIHGVSIGWLLCEDAWHEDAFGKLKTQGAQICCIINGSPFAIGKQQERIDLFAPQIKKHEIPTIYLNLIGGKDHLVFDGASFVLDQNGKIALQMPAFTQAMAWVGYDPAKKDPIKAKLINWNHESSKATHTIATARYVDLEDARLHDIYHAISLGLSDYLTKNHFNHVVLGLSGGIDSALAATIAADVFGSNHVTCLLMPSQFTAQTSLDDAILCAQNLQIKHHILSITSLLTSFLESLAPILGKISSGSCHENLQARIRGMLLMAHSNHSGSLLISTSNKSESACGYATLYGDMCGGYAPLQDVYKTDIFALANWRNQTIPDNSQAPSKNVIPETIITKPPSAELRNNQRDDDRLPAYDILDNLLFHMIERETNFSDLPSNIDPTLAQEIWHMVQNSEYKRSQAPIGAKISSRALQNSRRYPITSHFLKK